MYLFTRSVVKPTFLKSSIIQIFFESRRATDTKISLTIYIIGTDKIPDLPHLFFRRDEKEWILVTLNDLPNVPRGGSTIEVRRERANGQKAFVVREKGDERG
jgi:hypothetical protein